MKKTILTFLSLVVLLSVSSCSSDSEKEKTETEELPAVKVETVSEQEVDQIATYTATVEPEIVNNISAMMANRIKAIYVDEGMNVSAGQKLVLLDDVNTTSYEIQVDNAKANLRNVQLNYDRAVELLKIGGGTNSAYQCEKCRCLS